MIIRSPPKRQRFLSPRGKEFCRCIVVVIFHGIMSCIELEPDREISLTKALIELKKRSRELLMILNKTVDHLKQFFAKLVWDWSKFCLKDKYRKTRISSLNMLKSLSVHP